MATDDRKRTGSRDTTAADATPDARANVQNARLDDAPGLTRNAGKGPTVDQIEGADPGFRDGSGSAADGDHVPGGDANTGGGVRGATSHDVDIRDAVTGR